MKNKFAIGFICGALVFGAAGVYAGQYVAVKNPFPVKVNGSQVDIEGYNIEDSTYFKLRDIAEAVGGFDVDFKDNTIELTSSKPKPTPSPAPTPYVNKYDEPITDQELFMAQKPLEAVLEGDWQHSGNGYTDYYTLTFTKGTYENYAVKNTGSRVTGGYYEIDGNKLTVTLYADVMRTSIGERLTYIYRNGRLYYENSEKYLKKMH